MFEEEEDIVFENSPLEKYLKDVGYTDFEPEKLSTPSDDLYMSVPSNHVEISAKFNHFRSQVERMFTTEYDADRLKKDCISTTMNSGVLNVDDLVFLQRFDPELFVIGNHGSFKEEKESFGERLMSIAAVINVFKYSFAIFIGVLGIVLGAANGFGYYSFVLLVILIVSAWYYVWKSCHQKSLHHRHMTLLGSYAMKVKEFTSLMRKAVSLIQEMQFVFKGYTLVKAGVPMLFTGMDTEGENREVIYPALRESLYNCAYRVIMATRSAARCLVNKCPLSVELNNMFTYIGSVSLSEFGITEGSAEIDSRILPLQTLKTMASLVACQQSEFFSRFMLCLSSKAHDTDKVSNCLDKLHSNFHDIFADSLKAVDVALQSTQRSYLLHKSAVSEGEPKQNTQAHHEEVGSKFDVIRGATHSLELHLKAGCLRLQSIQALIEKLSENEDDLYSRKKQEIVEMETLFDLVKINLDSAVICWEEGLHGLQDLNGKHQHSMTTVTEGSEESKTAEGISVKEPQTVNLDCKMADSLEEETDQIFEAFSEPMAEDKVECQVTLSEEDLAKEKRQVEESRHLLLELKSVLYAHSKDPLISRSGFVQPPQKPVCSKQDDQGSSVAEFESDSHKTEELSKLEVQGFHCDMGHDRDIVTHPLTDCNSETQRNDFESNEKSSILPDKPSTDLRSEEFCQSSPGPVMKGNPQHLNFQSSVAFSVAAAALARSQSMGRTEEYFGSDESD